MMIIFWSKELLDIVKGTKMIDDVYDQRIWRKHNNESMILVINAIDERLWQIFWNAKLLQQCGKGYLQCMNRVQGKKITYSNNVSILPWNLAMLCLVSFMR
jgi:hypothetical protein